MHSAKREVVYRSFVNCNLARRAGEIAQREVKSHQVLSTDNRVQNITENSLASTLCDVSAITGSEKLVLRKGTET